MRRDCLNTMRLLAALHVLNGHALLHLHIGAIPIWCELISPFVGVPLFLTLSGFGCWFSIGGSSSGLEYYKKRFWRIFPELWSAVFVGVIVILLLYRGPYNWVQFSLYIIGQASFLQFWTPDCLRGYGCGCPNGALWTIGVMIQYYLISFWIYKLLHGKSCLLWIVMLGFGIVLSVWQNLVAARLPLLVVKLLAVSVVPYFWMFLFGAMVAEFKDRLLPLVTKWWFIFGALLIVRLQWVDVDIPTWYAGCGFTILLFCSCLGFAYSFPRLNVRTDISYGIYIYHMIIVNAAIVIGWTGRTWVFFGVVALTCVLSFVSTKTVGKFSMKRKIHMKTSQRFD